MSSEVIYQSDDQVFYPDTCEPLKHAANAGDITLHALVRDHYPGFSLRAGELEGVKSVGFWDAPGSQKWGLDWHRNEGIEITYLSRGQIGFAVDNETYALQQGALTITRPWQDHRVGLPHINPSRLHWLILDVEMRRPNQEWRWPEWIILSPDNMQRLTRLLQHNEQPVWYGGSEIGDTFEGLAALAQNPLKATCATRIAVLINQLLVGILELLEGQAPILDEELTSSRRGVMVFLQDLAAVAGESWTLDSMADACDLGRSQFARYCVDITNMTPIQFLTACRLENARKLLRQDRDTTITEVAATCGFESTQYFSTVFRKTVGLPPSIYRKQST